MNKLNLNIITWIGFFLLALISCQKEEYTFGSLASPSELTLNTTIAGVDAANPNGNGSGLVNISTTSKNAITYKIDFGDGVVQMVPSGTISYRYGATGTNEFTITVTAIGRGGVTSVVSKKVKVFVAFTIPATILENLTGSTSKVWICDQDADGHFGVGPADAFAPVWYAAPPNSRASDGFYNDEITFTKTASSQVTMNADNKGETFVIGAAISYYGLNGPEGKYPLVTAGQKSLSFMIASSASTTANSTRIQFSVPGNGLVMIGLGSSTYEILTLTSKTMILRTIGVDGNSWYQKLKVKP